MNMPIWFKKLWFKAECWYYDFRPILINTEYIPSLADAVGKRAVNRRPRQPGRLPKAYWVLRQDYKSLTRCLGSISARIYLCPANGEHKVMFITNCSAIPHLNFSSRWKIFRKPLRHSRDYNLSNIKNR